MADDKKKLPDIPAEAAADDSDDPLARAYIDFDENGRFVIRIDPKNDPTLDPESPEFDREKWEECQRQASESLKAAAERMKAAAERMSTTIAEAMRPAPEMGAAVRQIQEGLQGLAEAAAAAAQPFNFTAMQEYFNSDAWRRMLDTLELSKEVKELTPYLKAELKKPKYGGKTIDDLLDDAATGDDGNLLETSLFMQALTAARAARDAAAAEEKAPHAAIKKTNKIDYPLDKINSYVWNLLEKDTAGQVQFNLAKSGSKQGIPVYYSIDFDELDKGKNITITKRLLPFDKRVYIAVAALFNAGNNVITLTQIYNHMGFKGKPGGNDLRKINQSIQKMTGAKIYINNEAEAAAYKNCSKIIYSGSLLPLETGEVYNVQGALTNAAIHIFREPPLISFARQRKQITTVDIKLLQSPASKTNANLQIEDYLIARISRAKHSKAKNGKARSCTILFETLYARAGVGTKKQQQRAPKKICDFLDHCQKCSLIASYTTETDGITVYW